MIEPVTLILSALATAVQADIQLKNTSFSNAAMSPTANIALQQRVRELRSADDSVISVVFSPDGKTIASASDANANSIRLWDVGTGYLIITFNVRKELNNGVKSIAFSPDGKTIAFGRYDTSVELWKVATGKLITTFNAHRNYSVMSVVFSPNGKTIASGSDDNSVKLWDVATGREKLQVYTIYKPYLQEFLQHNRGKEH